MAAFEAVEHPGDHTLIVAFEHVIIDVCKVL